MKRNKTEVINFRVDEITKKALEGQCLKEKKKMSVLLMSLIDDYLNKSPKEIQLEGIETQATEKYVRAKDKIINWIIVSLLGVSVWLLITILSKVNSSKRF